MIHTRLDSLTKTYANGFEAIAAPGISLDINQGEFIVLVGPSGCGKSTLLRMIAGLETINTGNLYIKEKRVNDIEPGDRDIAMVFQNYALYPHMSVYKNMAYGLKNHGYPKKEIDARIRETAEMLGLTKLLGNKPSQLSGGERQRVAMGRAIARQPVLFLFDEPLSNLDAKLRTYMRTEIKQLQNRLGVTAVYVTHDQVEAMTMASRIVILNKGRIEQIGTPEEVYKHPKTLFVAGFIGSPPMNFLEGVTQNGVVQCLKQSIPFPADKKPADGEKLILGIRPEDFVLSQDATNNSSIAFETRLIDRENLGAHYLLHLTPLAQTDSESKTHIHVLVSKNSTVPENPTIYTSLDSIHLYDKKGQAL